MELQFIEFEQGPREQTTDRIHVTITRRGEIFLNRRALEALGEPDSVALLYDQRHSTIGIRRVPLSQKNGFRLRPKQKEGAGRVIYAANFCRHFHISPGETYCFLDAAVNKDGILVLNFHAAAPVRRK